MLFDPKWQKTEAKADPFALESLIAWLEKRKPQTKYEFWCRKCCLGRYFMDAGFDLRFIGVGSLTLKDNTQIELPPHFNSIAMQKPHTYGAALQRARATLLAE